MKKKRGRRRKMARVTKENVPFLVNIIANVKTNRQKTCLIIIIRRHMLTLMLSPTRAHDITGRYPPKPCEITGKTIL